jgi:hypothetical protein
MYQGCRAVLVFDLEENVYRESKSASRMREMLRVESEPSPSRVGGRAVGWYIWDKSSHRKINDSDKKRGRGRGNAMMGLVVVNERVLGNAVN